MLIANLIFLIMIILFAIKIRLDFENLKKKIYEQSDICKEMKIKSISDEERISAIEGDIKRLEEKISTIRYEVGKIKLHYSGHQILKTTEYQRSEEAQKIRPVDEGDMKIRIRKLLEEGKTPDEVQRALGVSYEEVKLVLNLINRRY